MKIGWGTGIAITYTSFVILLVGFVIYLKSSERSQLVHEDYYERGLEYEDQLNKKRHSASLQDQLQIVYSKEDEEVTFAFPKPAAGTIFFYRPSSVSMDRQYEIATNQQKTQAIAVQNLQPGLWKIQVDWQSGKVGYFDEKTIMVQ